MTDPLIAAASSADYLQTIMQRKTGHMVDGTPRAPSRPLAAEAQAALDAAQDAVDYHRLGYAGARRSEPWDADHMLALLDRLGDALDARLKALEGK